jgi:hypothetical protein
MIHLAFSLVATSATKRVSCWLSASLALRATTTLLAFKAASRSCGASPKVTTVTVPPSFEAIARP